MSEPILWAHRHRPPMRVRYAPNGDEIVEKFPNTAPPPEEHPLYGQTVRRWELMLDPQGNVHPCVYSGGAADYESDHPQYGRPIRRRQRRQGWLPYRVCPIAAREAGEIRARQLCPENQVPTERSCPRGSYSDGMDGAPGPCRHMLAEEAFRKARNAKRESKRMQAFQSEADKILAQNADALAKQGEAQTELVATVTKLITAMTGGGSWPMSRPNMTPEEYAKAYAEAQAKQAQEAAKPASGEPTSDEELERLMLEADAAAIEDDPPPPQPKGKRR